LLKSSAALNPAGDAQIARSASALGVISLAGEKSGLTVLGILAFTGLIAAVVRLLTVRRYRHRIAEFERLHGLERERTRIATDLHDDVGSNLATIALLSAEARKNVTGTPAEDFAAIQHIAETTADSMRDIVWFIESSEDELNALTLRMKETAGRLLTGLSWEFQLPPTLPRQKLSTDFKRHFFLIFKESLHNIRKHAKASKVQIDLRAAPGKVELRIVDNVVGLAERRGHAGIGLSSMRRRAAAQSWNLALENGAKGGTTVRLVAKVH
jgi:signal transduction histidine kinase